MSTKQYSDSCPVCLHSSPFLNLVILNCKRLPVINETVWSESNAPVLPHDVTTPQYSHAWNYEEVATLVTLRESQARFGASTTDLSVCQEVPQLWESLAASIKWQRKTIEWEKDPCAHSFTLIGRQGIDSAFDIWTVIDQNIASWIMGLTNGTQFEGDVTQVITEIFNSICKINYQLNTN